MKDLEPIEPARRRQRANPGERIHIAIKKLGRIDGVGRHIAGERTRQSNPGGRGEGLGWEFAHVAIDDASRIALASTKPEEKAVSAVEFLKAAAARHNSRGVTAQRLCHVACFMRSYIDRRRRPKPPRLRSVLCLPRLTTQRRRIITGRTIE